MARIEMEIAFFMLREEPFFISEKHLSYCDRHIILLSHSIDIKQSEGNTLLENVSFEEGLAHIFRAVLCL
jgi:hypothetical protein